MRRRVADRPAYTPRLLVLASPLTARAFAGVPRVELRFATEWAACGDELAGNAPPGALIIGVDMISETGSRLLHRLSACGQLIPTAIYFNRTDPHWVEAAWPLASLGLRSIFPHDPLTAAVQELLSPDLVQIAGYLEKQIDGSHVAAHRLVTLLRTTPDGLLLSSHAIARKLGLTRSTLYRLLAEAGLPGIEQMQFLFRLLPAMCALQRNRTASEAASMAQMADETTFRKTVKRRFGLSLSDVRSGDWRTWVDEWLANGMKDVETSSSDVGASRCRWRIANVG